MSRRHDDLCGWTAYSYGVLTGVLLVVAVLWAG